MQPGTPAPDFELRATPDQNLSLADFRGKPLILVFYPEDWSPVCSDQLALYQELLPEFPKFDAELIAVSVNGVWCHLAFAENRNFPGSGRPRSGSPGVPVASPLRPRQAIADFPLLADFEPKREISRVYGAYRSSDGTSARALFVIYDEGVVQWSYVLPVGINPGADGILRALEELDEGESLLSRTEWAATLALPVSEDRDHIQGPASATVTLLEYGDYECPYCGAAYPIIKEA